MNNTTKTKTQLVVQWAIWRIVIIGLLYFGLTGNIGAARLLIFWMWAFALLWLCCLASSDEIAKPLKKRGRLVPKNLEIWIDIGMMLALVWHGWWMTAIAVAIQTLCACAIYDVKPKVEKS